MSNIEPQAVAWQSDVFGQFHNDVFLAEFLDHVTNSDQNAYTLREQYAAIEADRNLTVETTDITDDFERQLYDLGYSVIWQNGVFVYKTEDLDLHDPE